ncbi:HIT family protein [Rhizobium sp. P40RR-XXII]|uniref:HIT family protein n=1 Tax=Rhizobium sp. P40RR-XXII TaxID=2726739 RepID=UPI003917CF8D
MLRASFATSRTIGFHASPFWKALSYWRILDTSPIRRGHVQITPRDHFNYFDDLPADLAGELVCTGQRIARAQKKLTA